MNNYCNQFNYLKLIASVVVITLALVLIAYLVIFISDMQLTIKSCDTVSDLTMAFLTLITLIVTCIEYSNHRKRDRAEVLGQYNERYSKDEHVNKVVDYIIRYMDGKSFFCPPSTHDAEMFMRFFEEMQIQIEQDRLVEEQVYHLFAYYAIAFDINDDIRSNLGIRDYDKDNWTWSSFKMFASTMFVRYFINDTAWKILYNNNNNRRLHFKDYNCKVNTEGDILTKPYNYSSGVITIDDQKYQYIVTGSNKPDELHQIGTDVVYVKCN